MGGDPNFGQLGKVIKPLEAEHGPQKVLAHWAAYLANPDTPDRVKNPSSFAQKFGLYAPTAPDPAGAHWGGDPSMVVTADTALLDD
jgi:hypothetical protein